MEHPGQRADPRRVGPLGLRCHHRGFGRGFGGQKLAALVLLVTAALAWVTWVLTRNSASEPAVATCLVVVSATGGALAAFSPIALVFTGVATLAAASRWTLVPAAGVGGVGAVSTFVATMSNGNNFAVVWGALSVVFTALMVGLTRRQAIEHAEQVTRLELASERTEVERTRAELLAERNHLARELHDVLAHTLAALSLQLEAFATVIDSEPETSQRVRDQLDRTRQLVREGLDEARGAVRALRDNASPLDERLSGLAVQHGATFSTSGSPSVLTPETMLALYRVAQEALTNVLKHATGADSSIELRFEENAVTLTVENTRGQTATSAGTLGASGGGFGLPGIRERLALVGGHVEAGPTPDGWRVVATVPTGACQRPSPAKDRILP